MALLKAQDLVVEYKLGHNTITPVDHVSLDINEKEQWGIVGESGCGKSTLARAIIGLLPPNGKVTHGTIELLGKNLVTMTKDQLRRVRCKEIALVPQNSMDALDPVYRIREQIVEAVFAHEKLAKKEALQRVDEALRVVGLDRKVAMSYPHQLSGGMKQRVVIAIATILNPSVLVADEPTTALDVITQLKILKMMRNLRAKFKTAIIYVTHDVAVAAQTCDNVIIMYAGRFVEYADTMSLYTYPRHPYTMGLMNAYPSLAEEKELISIPGRPPDLSAPQKGCRFRDRCPFSTEKCLNDPPLTSMGKHHFVLCHYADEAERFRELARDPETWNILRKEGSIK